MATNLDRLRSIQVSAGHKETAFGTPYAVDSLIRMNAGVLPFQQIQTINDSDHIGSSEEPTEAEVFARSLSFPFGQTRVKPHTLAWAAAFAMGSCSTTTPSGATNTRQHVITPATSATLPSFTLEGKLKSGLQKQYDGCFIDSFTFSLQRGANRFANLSGQAYGIGTVTDGTANQSEVAEGGLNAANAAIWLDDTTYDGSRTVNLNLTTSDLTSNPAVEGCNAISLEWGYNNNVDLDFAYCLGSGLYIGSADRIARSQTLTYTRLYQDETYVNFANAQTELAMQVRIQGALIETGFYYGAQLTFPLLQLASVVPGEQNGRLIETLTFNVLQHATHGSVILDVFNVQTGYAA